MSFSNRKILNKNINSQINKIKYDYFKCNNNTEEKKENEEYKTERFK